MNHFVVLLNITDYEDEKTATTLFQSHEIHCAPAAPAAEEATSQPLQGLVGSDAPTNLQIPDARGRGTTFSPSPPHCKLRQLLRQLSSKPEHRTKLLRHCCNKLPQTTNSFRSVCTMAPPPTAEIPLAQRLQRVASTLQCTCAIAAPMQHLHRFRDRMADFVRALQLPGSSGTSLSSESIGDSSFVAPCAGTRAGGQRLDGNHLVNFG